MMTDNNEKDKRFSKLLSTIERGKVLPDKQFLAQLRERSAEEFESHTAESKDHSQAETISIWRIIMKSRITKFATAAVIIIAVLIGINQFGRSVDMASVAFAGIKEAVSKAGWMFLKGSSVEVNGEEVKFEVWLSAKKQIMATKNLNVSNAVWLDYANKQRQIYEADANELTLMGLAREEAPDNRAMWNYLSLWFGSEMLTEAKIEDHVQLIDGLNVQVYDLMLFEDGDKCDITIIADMQTHLPISIVFKTENFAGEKHSAEFKCDYIDTGPENIYALGVPLDAKVINMLPSIGIKKLSEIFNKKRERFSPYVFVCVEPSQDSVYVSHVKGDTFDAAKHFKYVHYSYLVPTNYDIGGEIKEGVSEFAENLYKRNDAQLVSADLWDGEKRHLVDLVDCSKWSVSKSKSVGSIRSVGHFWPVSGMVGTITEDDYSKSHNLIAVKIGSILRYFDPLHDYLCMRYESRLDDGKILLREMGDLVQTEEGYWYPQSETGTVISFDHDGNETSREVTFVQRYFVEKVADYPEDYFDSDKIIPRILKWQNKQ